jgi:uncharacterized protein involved in high-affinity Fe2+ transport
MGVAGYRKQLQRVTPVQIFNSRRGSQSSKTAADNHASANIHQSMGVAGYRNSCRESRQCKYSPVEGGSHSSKTAADNHASANIHQSKGVANHRKQLQIITPVQIFTNRWGLPGTENSCRESLCSYTVPF